MESTSRYLPILPMRLLSTTSTACLYSCSSFTFISISILDDESQMALVRPLPWPLFLMLIVILRFIRFSLNGVACVFGYEKVTPKSMVSFMQRQRRSLRSLRLRGVKAIRQREFDELKDQQVNPSPTANLLSRYFPSLVCGPNKILEQQMQHRMTGSSRVAAQEMTSSNKPPVGNTCCFFLLNNLSKIHEK